MHPESGEIRLATQRGRESTDKPPGRMTESYRGGQLKLLFWIRLVTANRKLTTKTCETVGFLAPLAGWDLTGLDVRQSLF